MFEMNKLNRLISLTVIYVGIIMFSSCDTENNEVTVPKTTGVLVGNEGNFGDGNGSVSFYDEELMTITNTVVSHANSGTTIGSAIQSIFQHDGVGYLICNASDKIDFISMENFSYLANSETAVSQPRYMAVVGDKGYITCWGPWNYDDYSLPASYVAVLDLNTKKVVDTLECGSGPEGIVAVGNKLYIANSYETSVSVIDLGNQSSTEINFEAAPIHIVNDGSGHLWVSLSAGWLYPAGNAGVQAINTETMEKGTFAHLANIQGKMTIDDSGEYLYVLAAEPYPGTGTTISVLNTTSEVLAESPLITDNSINGIGYNLTTDKLYTAISPSYTSAGSIKVYDIEGTLLDEQVTSIGPGSFLFK